MRTHGLLASSLIGHENWRYAIVHPGALAGSWRSLERKRDADDAAYSLRCENHSMCTDDESG